MPSRLLRETLRDTVPPPPASGCLDAEMLAAWSDGTLSARDRAALESHASSCARCQALVAAMARTAPPASPRSWWRRSTIGWLVPLAAAAGAVALWIEVRPSLVDRAASSPRATASAPRAGAASASAPAVSERVPAPLASRDEVAPPAALQDRAFAKEETQRSIGRMDSLAAAAPPAAAKAAQESAAAAGAAGAVSLYQRAAAAGDAPSVPQRGTDAASDARGAAPAQSPQPQAAPRAEARSAVAPSESNVASSAATSQAQAPNPSQPAPSTTDRASSGLRAQAFAKASAAPAEIVSPNGDVRWHILATGRVARSTDGGATWQTQWTGVTTTLTAGVATSPTICWLVGPGGIVVSSTDGRTWQRVPFPEAIDLTSIRVSDGTTVTVTAADGRRFTTTDGGKAWRP